MSSIQLEEIKNKIKNKLDGYYLGGAHTAFCQTETNDYHIWLQLMVKNDVCNTQIKIVDKKQGIGNTYFSGPYSHIYGIAYSIEKDSNVFNNFNVLIYKKPDITKINVDVNKYLENLKDINSYNNFNNVFTKTPIPVYICEENIEWIGYAKSISDIKYGMLNISSNDKILFSVVKIQGIDSIIIKIT